MGNQVLVWETSLFILVIRAILVSSDDSTYMEVDEMNAYIEVDGIKVLREEFDRAERARSLVDQRQREQIRQFELEVELEKGEDPSVSKRLPLRCHVCRLFVEGMQELLARKTSEGKHNHTSYKADQSLVQKAFEEVCEGMADYRVTRRAPFRYVKGVSLLRVAFNDAQRNSKIRHWQYNIPESEIDDPTGEIRRLRSKCRKVMRRHESAILDWLQNHQDESSIDWICRKHVLKDEDLRCLDEEKLVETSTEVKAMADSMDAKPRATYERVIIEEYHSKSEL